MRIFLVEPYLTGSHRAWAEGYAAASRHDVHLIAHEGRFWKWRMHGAALTLAERAADVAAAYGPPDLVLASSMTDLPAFLGLARRHIGTARTVVYMHENQLTYPRSPRDTPDAAYPMTNWLSMAAADLVLFNSEFHRTTWFDALPGFLGQFPDYKHGSRYVDRVATRAEVLPVGVDLRRLDGPSLRRRPPLVLWNQRCEYDKGPGEFVAAVLELTRTGADFRVALAGERFVSEPNEFDELRSALDDRISHDGFLPDDEYAELLRSADVVVSTALQEFFGIAVTEAVYAGAFPVLPNRLVYPERLPVDYHDVCLYAGRDDLVAKLDWALHDEAARHRIGGELGKLMAGHDWSVMAPRYDDRFEALAAAGA